MTQHTIKRLRKGAFLFHSYLYSSFTIKLYISNYTLMCIFTLINRTTKLDKKAGYLLSRYSETSIYSLAHD